MNNLIETEEISNNQPCINCGELIRLKSNFCSHCGKNQKIDFQPNSLTKFSLIKLAALFFGLHLLLCLIGKLVPLFKILTWSITIDLLLAIISIIFFSLNWNVNKELLKWKNFSISKLCAFIAVAIICSYIVNYAVDWLNIVIYNKDENYSEILRHSYFGIFILIFFNAIMPALFEELGFRGFLLSNLIKITEIDQAVYVSAFLFAIIHLSFISLFWLIPFALFLGFTSIKEQTIWYGVIFHFSFNCTSEILSLIKH